MKRADHQAGLTGSIFFDGDFMVGLNLYGRKSTYTVSLLLVKDGLKRFSEFNVRLGSSNKPAFYIAVLGGFS